MMKLVLLPGMDGTGELFDGFVASLHNKINVQIVRYPTHRVLSYDELTSLLKSTIQGAEPFVLVAESFSTPLAIQYAATAPAGLRGLVLCAGFASSPVRRWLRPLCFLFAPLLGKAPAKSMVRFLLTGVDSSPSLVVAVRTAISRVQPDVLVARLHAVLNSDSRPNLRQIAVPILYLQATKDRLVAPSSLEEIRRVRPQVEVASVPGPHLLMQREPEQTSRLISDFIQRI